MTATDHRQASQARIQELAGLLRSAADARADEIVTECDALLAAVAAFHMEGIRFRMYNVDRLLRGYAAAPPGATALLEDVRRHLEAAGFHTRSHQSPL